VDAGVDMSMEQVLFTRDLFLPSMIEGCFSVGDILVLDRFLYNRGTVVTTSACGRTALRPRPMRVRSGMAMCSPRCMFHSRLLFLRRLR